MPLRPRHRRHPHTRGSGLLQCVGAGPRCRARCVDVVNEQHIAPTNPVTIWYRKNAAQIAAALRGAQFGLTPGVTFAKHHSRRRKLAVPFRAQPPHGVAYRAGQEFGLVESAPAALGFIERHGDDQHFCGKSVDRRNLPGQQRSQFGGNRLQPVIFQKVQQ